jgi:hypothetical protein
MRSFINYTLQKYYYADQTKVNEVSETISTHVRDEEYIQNYSRKA